MSVRSNEPPPTADASLGPREVNPESDRPYHLRVFRRNIRQCKLAIGASLAAALITGSAHFYVLLDDGAWKGHGWIGVARFFADLAIMALTISSTTIFLLTLKYRPFPARLRPADLGGLANMGLHRLSCVFIFLAALISVVAHALPGVVYTIMYRHGPPVQDATLRISGWVHIIALGCTFLSAGAMRRGPLLRTSEIAVGRAFGVKEIAKPRFWWEDDVGQDVIDYGNCSMLTFLTLGYSIPLAKRSREVPQLEQGDLPMLEEWIRTSGNEYLASLSLPSDGEFTPYTSLGLVKTLWGGRMGAIFITFVLETLNTLISFVQVTALYELIASFGPSDDYSYAYLMAWGLFIGQSIEVLLSAYLWVRENYILHNPVRFTISAILYAKILRSTDARSMEAQHLGEEGEKSNQGRAQVMNLLTMDTTTVASMATHVWSITNGLVRLAIGLVFLYKMLGFSAVVALLCVPLVTPVSVWIAKMSYDCDRKWARARDARTGAIKEFLSGIKVIKLNAFEDYEKKRVNGLRDVETKWQRWRFTLGTMFNIVADQMPNFAMLFTFIFYTKVMGETLEPATAFVAITVFLRVRSGLDAMPNAVDAVLKCKIALDRLKGFLNQAEVSFNEDNASAGGRIILDDATVSWPRAELDEELAPGSFQMKNMNVSLPVGRMTLVCGPLGAGKTLFLRSLLGEAHVDSGRIIAPRSRPDVTPIDPSTVKLDWSDDTWLEESVAYAPQASYIRHGTIRDNILFGQPFWEERYTKVLRQCSLLSDLQLMVDGDMTEVGENGVNLSGGQRARINLARCIYSRASTVYLDDILSAVDAHTAQFIVDQCFRGDLLHGRTLVLVSHHVDLCLPASDYVVVLNHGVVQQATRAKNVKIESLRAVASPKQEKEELPPTSPPVSPTRSTKGLAEVIGTLDELQNLEVQAGMHPDRPASLHSADTQLERAADGAPRALYTSEYQAHGHVATSHYMMMIKAAGGPFYWALFVILYLGTKGSGMLVAWVLQWWTADPLPSHLDHYLLLYIGANLATTLLGALRWVWLYGVGNVGWYSSGTKKIHRKLFATIANAPLSYFETTPAGRILNVFAQDTSRIDGASADDFGRTTMEMLELVAAAAVVGWEAPAMLLILVAFGVPLFLVANSLGQLRANLRRLSAVADSPLISLYTDSIDGVVMMRAFGLPNVMSHAMKALMTRSRSAETWNWIVYNWVRAVVLTLSSVFMTATALVLIGRDISPSKAGFILSFAVQISGNLFSLLEHFILLEQTFVSAERINHMITDTPQEPNTGSVPPASWPTAGRIDVRDLKIRYAPDLPDVLHGVSLSIAPGERVGLVGSTGSGKSTFALSLFRAVEPRKGSISIDGVDIQSVNLHELRKRLNMVVQDGSLPSGTLRNALDVSGKKDDAEIFAALKRVHLLESDADASHSNGQANGNGNGYQKNPFADLDTFVAHEGSNFSHGQRQLLCLARALLKDASVLVMDEATSSVDFDTDAKITATIKEAFGNTTMLVIAHRLATIVGFDKVLVLDRGLVKEYDRPSKLMRNPDSAFHSLCMAQGQEEYDRLLKLAEA